MFWLSLAVVCKMFAPSWDQIAYDGDFEYLPDNMPSVVGGRLLDDAFPEVRSRSQFLIVLARSKHTEPTDTVDNAISKIDEHVGLDLIRRLYHRLAEVSLKKAIQSGWSGEGPAETRDAERYLATATLALDEAIASDEEYYEFFAAAIGKAPSSETVDANDWPRLSIAYWDRANLRQALGDVAGHDLDRAAAVQLNSRLPENAIPVNERDLSAWMPLLDVLTWNDPVIGHRLSPRRARLIVLRSENELAAVGNIKTMNAIEELIAKVQENNDPLMEPGLSIVPTGTAAIGGETLRSSADAIRYTEVLTVVLILAVLALIYRAPLLVAIPLISIVVAVICATAVVAVAASMGTISGLSWVDLKVFTTSRIFVVVILFGAGTDYCLFLISRLREEVAHRPWGEAVEVSLSRVADALIGSALTTVVGLAMLWVSDFGKFHYSGPVIAICLLVALAVCTTLTPALLIAIGPRAFWPGALPQSLIEVRSPFWHQVAGIMTRRPIVVLAIGFGLLFPPAFYGFLEESKVTYDISSELGPHAVSRQGVTLLKENLPLGETNPMTLLIVRAESSSRENLEQELSAVVEGLYGLKGIVAVRSALDPLGDYPPGSKMGLFDRNAWRRRALQSHRISQQYFWSDVSQYKDRLVRLDIVTSGDPFKQQSAGEVDRIADYIRTLSANVVSPWHGASFAICGTTASIMDLRAVTISDAVKIKIWVVIAVFVILLVVLRKIGLSLYMIFTVLVSYYATMGVSVLFFRLVYGDSYIGLDWKVPIFLFVILVAVGQDYNVYLVTRILEERRVSHPLAAVRRAVARTGGIITSCGLVMALTFFSMTASAWVPGLLAGLGISRVSTTGTLRGITELGFALGFGVLLDTFYVRTVLVPAFCVLGSRQTETSENLDDLT